MQDNGGTHDCYHLAGSIARTLEKHKSTLETGVAEALSDFTGHLVLVGCHQPATYEIAFRLYREGCVDIGWARELRDVKFQRLLDQACHQWQSPGVAPKAAAGIAKAAAKLNSAELQTVVARAAERMEAEQPAQLSGAAMTALRQLLRWVQALPQLEVDEALYRICRLQWNDDKSTELLMSQWLPTILATIATRPKDRAFACLEQLAHNPQTKDLPAVLALYTQAMADVMGDVAPASDSIDGFPLRSDADRAIDAMLRAGADPRNRNSDPQAYIELAVRQAAADPSAMLSAMNARVLWLKQHDASISWRCDLGTLYHRILQESPKLTSKELAELCEVDSLGWLGVAPTSSLFEACEAYVEANGFEPELSSAMRAWAKTVHGGSSAQALRKAIDWLLWFDTEVPVDAKTCWSAVIHKDLRAMQPEIRGAWIALLRNVTFAIADEPTKKWLKPAPKLLKAIDPVDFRARVRSWFEPFQSENPLRITVAGRDILLALFWYTQLAQDPQIDEVLPSFGRAKWKAKSDRDRTARLLPVWIHTMRERCPDTAVDAIHVYKATGQLELADKGLELYHELCKREGRIPEISAPAPVSFDQETFMRQQLGKLLNAQLLSGLMPRKLPVADDED